MGSRREDSGLPPLDSSLTAYMPGGGESGTAAARLSALPGFLRVQLVSSKSGLRTWKAGAAILRSCL